MKFPTTTLVVLAASGQALGSWMDRFRDVTVAETATRLIQSCPCNGEVRVPNLPKLEPQFGPFAPHSPTAAGNIATRAGPIVAVYSTAGTITTKTGIVVELQPTDGGHGPGVTTTIWTGPQPTDGLAGIGTLTRTRTKFTTIYGPAPTNAQDGPWPGWLDPYYTGETSISSKSSTSSRSSSPSSGIGPIGGYTRSSATTYGYPTNPQGSSSSSSPSMSTSSSVTGGLTTSSPSSTSTSLSTLTSSIGPGSSSFTSTSVSTTTTSSSNSNGAGPIGGSTTTSSDTSSSSLTSTSTSTFSSTSSSTPATSSSSGSSTSSSSSVTSDTSSTSGTTLSTTTSTLSSAATTPSSSTTLLSTSSTSTSTTTTVAQGAVVTDDVRALSYNDAILQAHNVHRRNHSATDLTWSDNMATIAAQIAATCVYGHNVTAGGGGYGQNIGAGYTPSQVPAMVGNDMYNKEMPYYPLPYGVNNPDMSNFDKWGHFSQIVWKSTQQVGCATQLCPNGVVNAEFTQYFTVCNYSPPGNFQGAYSNVGAPLGQPITVELTN